MLAAFYLLVYRHSAGLGFVTGSCSNLRPAAGRREQLSGDWRHLHPPSPQRSYTRADGRAPWRGRIKWPLEDPRFQSPSAAVLRPTSDNAAKHFVVFKTARSVVFINVFCILFALLSYQVEKEEDGRGQNWWQVCRTCRPQQSRVEVLMWFISCFHFLHPTFSHVLIGVDFIMYLDTKLRAQTN